MRVEKFLIITIYTILATFARLTVAQSNTPESCYDILELQNAWSKDLYNGVCVAFNQGESAQEVYDRKSTICNLFATNSLSQCANGSLDTPFGTNKDTRSTMSLKYLKDCNYISGPCNPLYNLDSTGATTCRSKFKDGACNYGSCYAPAQHANYDEDKDGTPKCYAGGPANERGTGGCDCNESPFDCNDSDPNITTSFRQRLLAPPVPVYAIVSLKRNNGSTVTGPLNPLEPINITIKTRSCVTDMTALVEIDPGYGKPIPVGFVDFYRTPDNTTPGELVGTIGTDRIGNGWFNNVPATNFEDFLNAATTAAEKRQKPARIIVYGSNGAVSKSFGLTLCAPVIGTGPIKIAFLRTLQMKNFPTQVPWATRSFTVANNFWQYLFHKSSFIANPFKWNNTQFSLYADLSVFSETPNPPDKYGTVTIAAITDRRACRNSATEVIESGLITRSSGAPKSTLMAYGDTLNFGPFPRKTDIETSPTGAYYYTMTHEFAHSFGDLRDEYDVTAWVPGTDLSEFKFYYDQKNCASDTKVPTAFFPPGNVLDPLRAVCGIKGLYRSTLYSIMSGGSFDFNVVSCAHIMAKIFGGDYKSHYTKCKEYDEHKIG